MLEKDGWRFPTRAIDALAARWNDGEDEEVESLSDSMAELMREVARASKSVHETASESLKAAVEAVKGTDHRTELLIKENVRMGELVQKSQSQLLEVLQLTREYIIGTAEIDAQRVKSEADQTVRLERTKVAAKGMKMLTPVLKRGMAWALKAPELARDAQSEGLLELFRNLSDDKRAKLLGVMNEKQREAFENLATYAAAHESRDESLKVLKEEMTPEQGSALMEFLDQKELQLIMELFEDADEEDKPGVAKTKPAESETEKKSA